MAEEPTQAQAETTPAPTAGEAETTPETETAPVSTTLHAEEPSDSAGKAAGGVEGYLATKDKAIRDAAEKARAKAAPPAATEETSAVVEETTPVAASPAATTEEIPPVSSAEPTPPVETTPPPTVEDPDEGKKPDRIRIKGLSDGHLVAAATNIAREEGISFEKAFERVKPKPEGAPSTTESKLRARGEVEAEIETAKEERRNAAASADALEQGAAGKMVAAEEKIETLKAELEEIDLSEARAEQERQNTERTEFVSTVSESRAKAVEYWPDAGVEGSEFSNRMIELSDQYENDPRLAHLVSEADAPFKFAELVAKERGEIPSHLKKKGAAPTAASATPTTQPSTSTATKPAPVNQRAVVRPVQPAAGPASGAARTTQEALKDDLGVDKIRSVTDYERVKKKALAHA